MEGSNVRQSRRRPLSRPGSVMRNPKVSFVAALTALVFTVAGATATGIVNRNDVQGLRHCVSTALRVDSNEDQARLDAQKVLDGDYLPSEARELYSRLVVAQANIDSTLTEAVQCLDSDTRLRLRNTSLLIAAAMQVLRSLPGVLPGGSSIPQTTATPSGG
jgi:hypothetical protein